MQMGNNMLSLTPVVKHLMIINGLVFLGCISLKQSGIDLFDHFAIYPLSSDLFKPFQFLTHLFMHSTRDFTHIFSNMFMLFILGSYLERYWGSKNFLIYYLATGLGAACLHLFVIEYEISQTLSLLTNEEINLVFDKGYEISMEGKRFIDPKLETLNDLLHTPTVGASGAVFGALIAFGMLFPNMVFYFYFLFPIKAKYFVLLYGIFELWSGFSNRAGDNVAHFAHLGGMLFGFLIIKYWKKKGHS